MSKIFQTIKKGSILSETSFYIVKEINKTQITVVDDNNNEIILGAPYVELLNSAEHFNSVEEKNMTELAEIFVAKRGVAMEVTYITKDEPKTKKQYNQEVADAIAKVQSAKVSEVEGLLKDLITNPVSAVIPGKTRVMRGRHYGQLNSLQRVQFIDMEIPGTDISKKFRQVDPRTIQSIITEGVKYTLKK